LRKKRLTLFDLVILAQLDDFVDILTAQSFQDNDSFTLHIFSHYE
jgi:hypothetical protein